GLDPVSFPHYLHRMADVHNKKTRSYNMSRIRSGNTKPELLVRKFLHAQGFRYRLHGGKPADANALAGKPDIVLPKYKTIIFIHGCFWHGHTNCKYYVVPKTRTDWWLHKINTNKANDGKAVKALKKDGWKVITVWECTLKPVKQEKTLSKILEKLCS
ncbi:MAG: DNA mismatch endonuclease Vsr, partial [Bacteroidota bacterium]|nr:DNA mismatch endonuclease Vsr [Bacteroidota bacterium]